MTLKAVSLFSGQGGLDIGFEDAGYEILSAIEFNSHACQTMRDNRILANLTKAEFNSWFESKLTERHYKNWNSESISLLKHRLLRGIGKSVHFKKTNIIEADIRTVDAIDLRKHHKIKKGALDVVFGGPPCQPFSRSGKRLSVEDERGQLFTDFVRFVDAFRPRWFVLENVKGMQITKTSIVQAFCKSCKSKFIPSFEEYRCWVDEAIMSPCAVCGSSKTEYIEQKNVPGGSVDIIINEFERIGYTCQRKVLNALHFGAPQNRERLIIVGSRDNESYAFPNPTFSENESLQANLFEQLPKCRTTWDCLFSEPNPYHYPKIDSKKAVLWVKNVVRPHAEPVTWSLKKPCPTVGAHQAAKLAIAPFGVPEEQLKRQQWHTLGKRQGDTPPVHVEHTYLSDEDLLKLQTFPDYWFVSGTRMERAFQIGNAVPPVLADAVAKSLNR